MPGSFVLPLVLALPVLGAIFVMCTPKSESSLHRGLGITFTMITFLVSLLIFKFYSLKSDAFQLVFDAEWIPGLGAHFKTGVDGISVLLVILTTFLMPLTLLGTRTSVEKHSREFMASMLILLAAVGRRYYLDGRSKVEIAEEFGFSRFKVARLIDAARESGIVHIEIRHVDGIDADLSARLQEKFHLQHAVVVVVQHVAVGPLRPFDDGGSPGRMLASAHWLAG